MLALALTLAAATTATPATTPAPAPSPPPLVEQVETMGFYQLETPSWAGLDAKQKRLAYWLSRAAIAIDPIIYDQLSTFGIPEKRLLSALVEDPGRLPPESREAILRYAKLFFAHRGNHNRVTNKKFVPELTFEQFADAAHAALNAGARLGTVQ